MSSGQTPRTPEYFPRMKRRGAGRRERKRREILAHFLAMGEATPGPYGAMEAFAEALREFVRPIAESVNGLFRTLVVPQTRQSDYALAPAREEDHQ